MSIGCLVLLLSLFQEYRSILPSSFTTSMESSPCRISSSFLKLLLTDLFFQSHSLRICWILMSTGLSLCVQRWSSMNMRELFLLMTLSLLAIMTASLKRMGPTCLSFYICRSVSFALLQYEYLQYSTPLCCRNATTSARWCGSLRIDNLAGVFRVRNSFLSCCSISTRAWLSESAGTDCNSEFTSQSTADCSWGESSARPGSYPRNDFSDYIIILYLWCRTLELVQNTGQQQPKAQTQVQAGGERWETF